MEIRTMIEGAHEPTEEEKEDLFRPEEEVSRCNICGEPMPDGEEMFKFHGYSGPCPKPPLPKKEQCDHNWITAEHIDLPEGTGYITNVTKLYCPKCDEIKKVEWNK